MDEQTALTTARESKSLWDAGDYPGAGALRDIVATWAATQGWVVDQSAEGILSLVRDGASEQLL